MSSGKSKATVKDHLKFIYQGTRAILDNPFWLDPDDVPLNNDKAAKLLGMFQVGSTEDAFVYGVLSMIQTIKKNLPPEEEIVVFLDRYVKPEFHEALLDQFDYFNSVIKQL